ncbi:hypothetical protein F5051DRAFT_444968 [Lentinula edodes]|nr:hypothetical protein F5051DRAFT_444968 [Lentinula edodes]
MSKQSDETFPKPPQAPYLLHELWDLDLGDIKASHHIHPCIASLLPPPLLEDTNHSPPLPRLTLHCELSHLKLTSSTSYNNPTHTLSQSPHDLPPHFDLDAGDHDDQDPPVDPNDPGADNDNPDNNDPDDDSGGLP